MALFPRTGILYPDPGATGLLDDTLNVIVTAHDCADRVAARLLGSGAGGAGGAP